MFVNDIVNSGSIPALDSTLSFLSARLGVIAENIANADTVGYRTKQLDAGMFQNALARAIEQRDPAPGSPLRFKSTPQFRQAPDGGLVFTPRDTPAGNVMFHDRSDMRIESQMKNLAETVMMHQAATELLRGQYDALKKAIRGRLA